MPATCRVPHVGCPSDAVSLVWQLLPCTGDVFYKLGILLFQKWILSLAVTVINHAVCQTQILTATPT